jgi:hypothetical protein
MGLANSEFPASAAFDLINQGMVDEPAEKKDAIKKAGAIFAFTLKNKAGKQESWYIDLKNDGTVGKGAAPQSGKADGVYALLLVRTLRVCRRECDTTDQANNIAQRSDPPPQRRRLRQIGQGNRKGTIFVHGWKAKD